MCVQQFVVKSNRSDSNGKIAQVRKLEMKIDGVYEYLIQMAFPFMEHFIKLDLFTRISIRQTPECDERFTISNFLWDIKRKQKTTKNA